MNDALINRARRELSGNVMSNGRGSAPSKTRVDMAFSAERMPEIGS